MKTATWYGPKRFETDDKLIEARKVVITETGEHFQVFRRAPDLGKPYKMGNVGKTKEIATSAAVIPFEIVTARTVVAAIHRSGRKLNGLPLGKGIWARVYAD